MIGNPDGFYPLSVELGLETATLFGGSSYDFVDGKMQLFAKGGTGFGAFARAFISLPVSARKRYSENLRDIKTD